MTLNLNAVQALAQLQALQNLGSSESNANSLTSKNETDFSSLLASLMGAAHSTDGTNTPSNGLVSMLSSGQSPSDLLSLMEGSASSVAPSDWVNLLLSSSLGSLTGNTDPENSLLGTGNSDSFSNPTTLSSLMGHSLSGLGLGVSASTQVNATTNSDSGTSPFDSIINQAATAYNIDPNLIRSVIQQESGFNPTATSPSGALGLMQLMPATAVSLGVTDPMDPSQNIMGGTQYLSTLLNKYEGNKTLALAAYNAGPSAVDRYQGIPPYDETTNYVKSILQNYYSA